MLKIELHKDVKTGVSSMHTNVTGNFLLQSPLLNKGTAFTQQERLDLNLEGKLPSYIETLEEQVQRIRQQYQGFETVTQKQIYLRALQDKNEVLFYRFVSENLDEMLPQIYTPGIAKSVRSFHQEFRHPRGIYLSYEDRDRMDAILATQTHAEIRAIVVSDGESVLGIGDYAIGSMEICIAKMSIYTICGLHPCQGLPVVFDVGTNNEALLKDPMYLGWRHRRIDAYKYHEFVEKFIHAIRKRFPHVLLHWEDFGSQNARYFLNKYRDQLCTFNDDMQGTGAVCLGTVLSAVEATGIPIGKQRIVIFGAGTAGVGIADRLCDAMMRQGMSLSEARKGIWLIDRHGLLIENTPDIADYQLPYARTWSDLVNWTSSAGDLENVVRNVAPTVLIGCSTVKGAFTQKIVEMMAKSVDRPVILPLSNPTEKCEALPADLMQWTQGRALIAAGSPFNPVGFQGNNYVIAQCNNALAFPGIGLGAIAAKSRTISEDMLWVAADAIYKAAPVRTDAKGALLSPLCDIRKVAYDVAVKVAAQSIKEGSAQISTEDARAAVDAVLWKPEYCEIRTIK